MADWNAGYVADLEYLEQYYEELAPWRLRFLSVLRGYRPSATDGEFTYLDLGCGLGLGVNLLAAANPQASFFGLDFNPAYVAHAENVARRAGLPNARFLERSFAQLDELEIPDLDVVVMHGVWSWVDAANRASLLRFLARKVRPGGLVYVSYNALPWCASEGPLQRLLLELSRGTAGTSAGRLEEALKQTGRVKDVPGGFFERHPVARERLEGLPSRSPNYLAHEYLTEGWQAFYHVDVSRELRAAKLEYLGDALLADNFEELMLSRQAIELAREIGGEELHETVKDFVGKRRFRRDVYLRGRARCGPGEHGELLGSFRLARLSGGELTRAVEHRAHKITLPEKVVAPLERALEAGPRALRELAAEPDLERFGLGPLARTACILQTSGELAILPPAAAPGSHESCARLNRLLLGRVVTDEWPGALACPETGGGLGLDPTEPAALAALQDGCTDLLAALRAEEITVQGAEPEATDEETDRLQPWVEEFQATRLPVLRRLGVLPAA